VRHHRTCWLLALALGPLLPRPAVAQSGAAPAPRPPQASAAAPQVSEFHLRAETQEMVEKGHFRASGLADLQMGDSRLQADVLDLYEEQRPDGQTARRIVATGNVVFFRGEERISGDRMEMELDTGHAIFENAQGYVQPGVLVEAKRIERVDDSTYRMEGASFTSCYQPSPRWNFHASSARLEVDDKIVAHNVLFKVKGVPAFYTPFIMYPINEDKRATGFLLPEYGNSSYRGTHFREGFFWVMGRSFDQTFYGDYYSNFGTGFAHQLRYALQPPSNALLDSYFLWPKGGGDLNYGLNWRVVQVLPGGFRGTVLVNQTSTSLFQQQAYDNFEQVTNRTQSSSASLQRSFGATYVQLVADRSKTLFGDEEDVRGHLPSLMVSRFSQQIGRTGLSYNFQAKGEYLELGNQDLVNRYGRADVLPELDYNFGNSFLQVTPAVQERFTRYQQTVDSHGDYVDVPMNRHYTEAHLTLRGPKFSRIFNTSLGDYTDKFKHTISPEVEFLYRSDIPAFTKIPQFDEVDFLVGTRQLTYGLVQSLFARRPIPRTGKLAPYEFMRLVVRQTYYFDIANGQNERDPQYAASVFGRFFVGQGIASHKGPIDSRLRIMPTREFQTNVDMQYDVNFHAVRRLGIDAALNTERVGLRGNWSRLKTPSGQQLVNNGDFVQGSARFALLPKRVNLLGEAYYDFQQKQWVHTRAALRYDVQCCGLTVETIHYKYGVRDDNTFRISIDLANIGSVGNFFGDDQRNSGIGIGGLPGAGYR
jgi:LPS-assembly protein